MSTDIAASINETTMSEDQNRLPLTQGAPMETKVSSDVVASAEVVVPVLGSLDDDDMPGPLDEAALLVRFPTVASIVGAETTGQEATFLMAHYHCEVLKFTNKSNKHNGVQYCAGPVSMLGAFDPETKCADGLYASWDPKQHAYYFNCRFINVFVWDITFHPNASVMFESASKLKANHLILSNQRRIDEMDSWKTPEGVWMNMANSKQARAVRQAPSTPLTLLAQMTHVDELQEAQMNHVPEIVQIAAIRDKSELFRAISNPSIAVQREALFQDGMLLECILDADEALQAVALVQDINAIRFIKHPTPSQLYYCFRTGWRPTLNGLANKENFMSLMTPDLMQFLLHLTAFQYILADERFAALVSLARIRDLLDAYPGSAAKLVQLFISTNQPECMSSEILLSWLSQEGSNSMSCVKTIDEVLRIWNNYCISKNIQTVVETKKAEVDEVKEMEQKDDNVISTAAVVLPCVALCDVFTASVLTAIVKVCPHAVLNLHNVKLATEDLWVQAIMGALSNPNPGSLLLDRFIAAFPASTRLCDVIEAVMRTSPTEAFLVLVTHGLLTADRRTAALAHDPCLAAKLGDPTPEEIRLALAKDPAFIVSFAHLPHAMYLEALAVDPSLVRKLPLCLWSRGPQSEMTSEERIELLRTNPRVCTFQEVFMPQTPEEELAVIEEIIRRGDAFFQQCFDEPRSWGPGCPRGCISCPTGCPCIGRSKRTLCACSIHQPSFVKVLLAKEGRMEVKERIVQAFPRFVTMVPAAETSDAMKLQAVQAMPILMAELAYVNILSKSALWSQLLEIDPTFIRFNAHPSEDLQMDAVNMNASHIQHIRNPCRGAMEAALRQDPTCLALIRLDMCSAERKDKITKLAQALILASPSVSATCSPSHNKRKHQELLPVDGSDAVGMDTTATEAIVAPPPTVAAASSEQGSPEKKAKVSVVALQQ